MNSQQELLDAINTISQKADKSCDTPATVLRVEDETVWVHIDGGADETPVTKTINCVEGDTVQVRISNGSAFIVGNATAPPTDDSTANVAHFVAEQAEIEAAKASSTAEEAQIIAEEARQAVSASLITYETWYILSATTPTQPTEESHTGWSTVEPAWSSSSTDNLYFSVRTVKGDGTATWSSVGTVQSYADLAVLKNAIISTVASEYVGQGDSGITDLSSTMLQNTHGVNIYNDTLAVGDSYAHIDGDSFDIKEVTTAGTIDDTNDPVVATFGTDGVTLGRTDVEGYLLELTSNGIDLTKETPEPRYTKRGWHIGTEAIDFLQDGAVSGPTAHYSKSSIYLQSGSGEEPNYSQIGQGEAVFNKSDISAGEEEQTEIDGSTITLSQLYGMIPFPKTILSPGTIQINGQLQDLDGNNLLDEWVGTTTVSSGSFSFSGLNDDYAYSRPFIYVDDTSTEKNPTATISSITGTASNRTITWTTNADSGASVKLRRIK